MLPQSCWGPGTSVTLKGSNSAAMTDPEEILHGGNTSVVVRVGDTVRRTPGPWNAAVHALLAHLHDVGFDGAPTVVGFDGQGRESLRYVDGEVGLLSPGHPLPAWFRTDDACMAIGDWLRRFHDAQSGFRPDPDLPWRMQPGRQLTDGEVIVHHDVAPYNTIRRPNGLVSVIDWDFCAPGDPIEDLAFAAWQGVPLWADDQAREDDHGGAPTMPDAARRLVAMVEGYGATAQQRRRLPGAVMGQMAKHADDVERLAQSDPAFARLVELGVPRHARLDAAWAAEVLTGLFTV